MDNLGAFTRGWESMFQEKLWDCGRKMCGQSPRVRESWARQRRGRKGQSQEVLGSREVAREVEKKVTEAKGFSCVVLKVCPLPLHQRYHLSLGNLLDRQSFRSPPRSMASAWVGPSNLLNTLAGNVDRGSSLRRTEMWCWEKSGFLCGKNK